MINEISYYRKNNDIECIYYRNSTLSYPLHTHANHITIGYITAGELCVICDRKKFLYHASESFCIMPDVLHTLEAVNNTAYSMISICVPIDKAGDGFIDESSHLKRLKSMIIDSPENTFFIKDMARNIGVSPYHMIRRFKKDYGLTPHQFQIQCRIRKAQRLLEDGGSVTEAAYATGFCDQSHFDRFFRKIVRLTPSEYKLAVKILV